jgi:hypothetical protein
VQRFRYSFSCKINRTRVEPGEVGRAWCPGSIQRYSRYQGNGKNDARGSSRSGNKDWRQTHQINISYYSRSIRRARIAIFGIH